MGWLADWLAHGFSEPFALLSRPSPSRAPFNLARRIAAFFLFTTFQRKLPSSLGEKSLVRVFSQGVSYLGVRTAPCVGGGSPRSRAVPEHRGREEIKKEIVSSRCFKLPFITTHKPDRALASPTSGHLVPPMGCDATTTPG